MSNQQNWTDDELDLLNKIRAGKTVVVNMRSVGHPRFWEWAKDHDLAVRIDRKSDWGNPFTIPRDGNRDEVIAKHAADLPNHPELIAEIGTLRGKVLGCWCAPLRCHGDLLAELSNEDTP